MSLPVDQEALRSPVDISHHFSVTAKNRKPSAVKDFYKYFSIPGIGNLAGGLPNENYFPFDTLEGVTALPQRFEPTPPGSVDPPLNLGSSTFKKKPETSRVVVPKESEIDDRLREIDLKTALQYGTAQGYPPLYAFLRHFTREKLHPNVPYKGGPEIVLTCGNTDGWAKVVDAVTNVWIEGKDPMWERQGVLCEEFVYGNALQAIQPRGLNIVPVAIDEEGMMAEGKRGLEDVLENWDFSLGKRPSLIYSVTIGQNPTGGVLGIERRKALYTICVKFDVLIVEDDPYWYLQYPSAALSSTPSKSPLSNADSHFSPEPKKKSFLSTLVPSFLSIDTQGRVVRLDTFSKTVAPGCRLGWVTAQPSLIDRILKITETSTQQPSGFVQALVSQLLVDPICSADGGVHPKASDPATNKPWTYDGWTRWLEGLRGAYERRMQIMCDILEDGRHAISASITSTAAVVAASPISDTDTPWTVLTAQPMYSFLRPRGGMFIWLQLYLHTHPLFPGWTGPRLARALWEHLTEPGFRVLVAPGAMFGASDKIAGERGWMYFRICFAAIEESEVRVCSERFVRGVRTFWELGDEVVRALEARAMWRAEGLGEGGGTAIW